MEGFRAQKIGNNNAGQPETADFNGVATGQD